MFRVISIEVCVDFSFTLSFYFSFFQANRYDDIHSPSRRLIILAAKLSVKMPNPPYNKVTNVVSDGNNGYTFPMYSIEEAIARNVRDSAQYLHEEEMVYLNLDEDGDGDNHYGENDGVVAYDSK